MPARRLEALPKPGPGVLRRTLEMLTSKTSGTLVGLGQGSPECCAFSRRSSFKQTTPLADAPGPFEPGTPCVLTSATGGQGLAAVCGWRFGAPRCCPKAHGASGPLRSNLTVPWSCRGSGMRAGSSLCPPELAFLRKTDKTREPVPRACFEVSRRHQGTSPRGAAGDRTLTSGRGEQADRCKSLVCWGHRGSVRGREGGDQAAEADTAPNCAAGPRWPESHSRTGEVHYVPGTALGLWPLDHQAPGSLRGLPR